MSSWVTADLHLGHTAAYELFPLRKGRWSSVEAMDADIIEQWNRQVASGDTVYVLGDFSFHPERYVSKLNGTKLLVLGNHDPRDSRRLGLFDDVYDTVMVEDDGYVVFLSHYPHRVWPRMHHGARHLYGHVHGEIVNPIIGSRDVGWEAAGFKLLPLGITVECLPEPTLADLQAEAAR